MMFSLPFFLSSDIGLPLGTPQPRSQHSVFSLFLGVRRVTNTLIMITWSNMYFLYSYEISDSLRKIQKEGKEGDREGGKVIFRKTFNVY